MNPNIYDYIKEQESIYETDEIQLGDNWFWNMRKHVQMIFHAVNGIFYTGENNFTRAFKKIMKPIINLANWSEDLEVKDVVFYIPGREGLSFLVKKYHDEVYTHEHDLDKLFDEITENDNTYGGVLVQKGKKRPEALSFQSVAFADQTDLMGGAIGFKMNFSPSKLMKMSEKGWGKPENGATISLDELVTMAESVKDAVGTRNEDQNKGTSKNIEVYLVRGSLPNHYLNDDDDMENSTDQIQVVAFYTKKDNKKEGVTLYRKKDVDGLKFFSSDPVFQRALGSSVGEDMLPNQVWTNFLTIHKMNLLESASKVPLYTDDPTYRTKNKIQDMENLEITTIEDGKKIYQVPTASPTNIQLLQNAVDDFFSNAQLVGSAFDPILGKEQVSGTTFRGQERTVAQGKGSHDRKRGKRAKFIEEIYRDWVLPDIIKEIVKGQEFLSSLSTDELGWVADRMVTNRVNARLKEKMMKMELLSREERDELTVTFKDAFKRAGNKQLLKILKDEFKDIPIRININVANKQKNLAELSDKVLSIFQFVFANPQAFQQAMQIPALSKSFSDILEYSGMSIGDFSTLVNVPAPQILEAENQGQNQTEPLTLTAQNE